MAVAKFIRITWEILLLSLLLFLSPVQLFSALWTAALQDSLSFTISWSLLKLMSNQSILKEISPGISLEGMMLKLKLQSFGHLMRRVDSLEKTLMLGQEEKGTREDEMAGWHHWLNGREWVWVNSGSWWWTGRPGVLRFMGLQRVGHNWATDLIWSDVHWIGDAL